MANSLDMPISKENLPTEIKKVDVMKEEFGIDIPVESVPLPSRGIIYSKNSGFFDKETLDIRPMTAREEDILSSKAYIKNGTVLAELIKSCLVDKNINPDDLISGDRNALLISLRITGYGSEYNSEVDCPACGFTNKSNFNLADLKIKRLSIDPIEFGQNLFQVQLPVTKKNVKVKFLTGHDEKEMSIIDERKRKNGINSASVVTDRLCRSIVEVEGITDKNKIRMFVNNMPVRDSLSLRRFLEKNEPGIDMSVWLSCNSCHEESEVLLPMGTSFFWPDV
jgi:hypothetical protein